MTAMARVILSLAALGWLAGCASADEPLTPAAREKLQKESAKIKEEARGLLRAGKPAEALRSARQALAIDERLYPAADYPDGHASLAQCLMDAGAILEAGGEAKKALEFYEKALAMNQRLYPAEGFKDGHPALADSWNHLGTLLGELHQADRALACLQRALPMYERLFPPDRHPAGHPEAAACLNSLGTVLAEMGREEQAVPYFERAVAMRERLHPDGHPDLAATLDNLGILMRRLGENEKAVNYRLKALAVRDRLYPPERFKDGHPDLVRNLNGLTALLLSAGEYRRAQPYLERALAMSERLYPPGPVTAGHRDLVAALNNLAAAESQAGEYGAALRHAGRALEISERLYPPERFPDGHPDLAINLNGLGLLLDRMGEYARALACHERALAMRERLYPPERYPNGHPHLGASLNNIGLLLTATGEYGKALPYLEKSLAMAERLYPPQRFPNGNPRVATSLSNLGQALEQLGEHGKAEAYLGRSLAMCQRLYPPERFKEGQLDLLISINDMSVHWLTVERYDKALPSCERALAMAGRLFPPERFPRGHPMLASCLNSLGQVHRGTGQLDKARDDYEKALAIVERLYPPDLYRDGHPHLTAAHNNLGVLLRAAGEHKKALRHLTVNIELCTRQARRETANAPEAQALAFLQLFSSRLDGYLLGTLSVPEEPVTAVYAHVWPTRGLVLQLASRRHQSALVATSASAETRRRWERLTDVRRQLNRLAVEPGNDVVARDRLLVHWTAEQEKLEGELARELPELDRHRRLAGLGPEHLRDNLPPGTAFIDVIRHGDGETGAAKGYRYQAFLLAPGRAVRRVNLADARPIDDAIASWRRAIDNRLDAGGAPDRLKELVWDKLAAELPAETKTVYLCPDGDLARLPWGALPGRKAGSVLLEDLAVAVVPSGPWLLEQLLYPPKAADGPGLLVAAGAIDYGAAPRGRPADYPPLAETGRELTGVLAAFGSGEAVGLRGAAATPSALKERLARARYAHFATHGYFDQAGVAAERRRLKEQIAGWEHGAPRSVEWVGVTQHPLGYVGLALAGANDPRGAADGGILTGLGIVDLPLESLRLCTLSACETGLGELTEGEGVMGLQRAFHVAGCPNVVGSLWKVNDAATAALMAKFYHELWANKRPPIEALREAQLTVYRRPDLIPDLAGERGPPRLKEAVALKSTGVRPPDAKGADTKLWAAFVLSGVGQ
jgi:tetratricopeptide (TPR) repeat protein/CHAT domain-containing protein